MEKITIPRKEHLEKGKIVITEFECKKCGKVSVWLQNEQRLNETCSCGWVFLKPTKMRAMPSVLFKPKQKGEEE